MTRFLIYPATAGCRSDPLGIFPEQDGCRVGRATLPIGLSFGASAAGQIYVKCSRDNDEATESDGPSELPPARSRGMKPAMGRAIPTCRRMTVRQPAPDPRLDHRLPVSPAASFFDRIAPARGCPQARMSVRLQPTFGIIHEVVWLNSGVCKSHLLTGLNVRSVLRAGNKSGSPATVGRPARFRNGFRL